MADVFLSTLTGGGIKNVQRGQYGGHDGGLTTLTISSINPSKSFINVSGYTSSNVDSTTTSVFGYIQSATQIVIGSSSSSAGGKICWEVVEFY